MEMALGALMNSGRSLSKLNQEVSGVLKGSGFKDIINQQLSSEDLNVSLAELKGSLKDALEKILQKLQSGDMAIEDESKQLIDSLKELNAMLGDQFNNELVSLLDENSDMNSDEALELMAMILFQSQNQSISNNPLNVIGNSVNQSEVNLLVKILKLSDSLSQGKTAFQNANLDLPKGWASKFNDFMTLITGNKEGQSNQSNISNQLVKAVQDLLVQPKHTFQEYKLQLPRSPQLDSGKVMTTDHSMVSRQEQLVIHMTRPTQQASGSSSQQFIEQLQKMIQSTRFNQLGGQKQLSIQLKPANLGDMMLRFTQIDGQMAVKITVTSQVAKEMLEGNLQQLRHMFSPNQVVIERQVDQPTTEDQQNFLGQEDEQSSQQGSDQEDQQNSDSNDDQGKSFKDFLFEEEV